MSCNHCSTKFNFFHKEMGCSSCGLSFCTKCLKQKCRIPSKGPGEYAVCKSCHTKVTSGTLAAQTIPPPDTFFKRLQVLENPSCSPITSNKVDKSSLPAKSLSPVDQKLLERLENLKDKGSATRPPPSEAELRKRLANLKGDNDYVEGPSKPILATDTRSDQQKVDALLDQFTSERDIELAHNPQEDIEARLASLREQGVRPNKGVYISNLHDSSSSSEEEINKVTKKIMDEVALEDRFSFKLPCPEYVDEIEEELPWCVLCNKDAKYRCLGCGGDLYCANCKKEVHSNWEGEYHRVVKFSPK